MATDELMPIQDLKTAQEECRLCFARWQQEMKGLGALVEQASEFTAAAFLESAHARMPELHRANKAVLARLSILIQVLSELESENQLEQSE
jgi:hypothetical protein